MHKHVYGDQCDTVIDIPWLLLLHPDVAVKWSWMGSRMSLTTCQFILVAATVIKNTPFKSYSFESNPIDWHKKQHFETSPSASWCLLCVWRSVSPSLQWPAGFLTQLSLSQALTTAPVFWPAKSAACCSSQITHWRIPIQLQHNLASGASPCCVHQGKWRNTATVNAALIDSCLNVWVVCYTWLQVTTWRLTSAPTATLSVISDWASAAEKLLSSASPLVSVLWVSGPRTERSNQVSLSWGKSSFSVYLCVCVYMCVRVGGGRTKGCLCSAVRSFAEQARY